LLPGPTVVHEDETNVEQSLPTFACMAFHTTTSAERPPMKSTPVKATPTKLTPPRQTPVKPARS
jgi:hypothetical protein